jgi:hypothetical protein
MSGISKLQMKRASAIIIAFSLLAPFGLASAQSPRKTTSTADMLPLNAVWSTALAGKWTYRSYLNRADIMVNSDPDSAVQALVQIFGQGVAAAASALKAFDLVFGEGVMTFDPPIGNSVTGNFDMGGGYVLDLKGTMQTSSSGDIAVEIFGTGRAGTKTENWEYDYKASTTPKWPNGVNQVPSLVGTVIRAKPHDGGAAGIVASFIAIKQ